jgi:uncharacterized protein YbgA (DUF1722 family)/uncharacterized protein YbbK (DUF523 family)
VSPEGIRIGISSCLLGEEVRYDGGHKYDGYITETLGRYFTFVPYCPEVAVGLGVPRQPIRLVQVGARSRARGVTDPTLDVTDSLEAYAESVAMTLGAVSGYILKKGSPSCGMERVKQYNPKGMPVAGSAGIYARALMDRLPELPFEEEGRLMDPVLRENFVERVFVYRRWQQLIPGHLTPKALVEFHTRHKLLVLAHDEKAYRALGLLVAAAGTNRISNLGTRYIKQLMEALKKPATPRRHANVLQHVFGFFKSRLNAGDKREVVDLVNAYRRGQVPLIVPITLLRHYLRRFPDPYLAGQHYLTPQPDELMLRNQI